MNRTSHESLLEARFARLERRARVLTVLLAVALLGILQGFFLPGPQDAEVLRVGGIQMVDAQGLVRGELVLEGGQPSFRLLDEAGVVRASLSHDGEGTALYIMDSEGVTRLGAAQFSHGGGGFALHGPDSRGAAVLYLQGAGSLRFFDESGAVTAQFPSGG